MLELDNFDDKTCPSAITLPLSKKRDTMKKKIEEPYQYTGKFSWKSATSSTSRTVRVSEMWTTDLF